MYDVAVELEISSAHQLRGYQGKCEKYHGHNWRIRLEVTAAELDAAGLAMDFHELKALLSAVVEPYDHAMLNDLPDFQTLNPTSENLARLVYSRCREKLDGRPVRMRAVTVWESPKAFVRYYE